MRNILFKNMIVLITIGLLLLLIVYNGVKFYQLQTEPFIGSQVSAEQSVISQSKKNISPQTIIRWHLFGKETVKQVQAPKTTLRLKLIGIISSTNDNQARVIIEDSSRKQLFYKVGDKIKNNVTVKSIHPNHIVIMHNSREEIVQLKSSNTKETIITKVVI